MNDFRTADFLSLLTSSAYLNSRIRRSLSVCWRSLDQIRQHVGEHLLPHEVVCHIGNRLAAAKPAS